MRSLSDTSPLLMPVLLLATGIAVGCLLLPAPVPPLLLAVPVGATLLAWRWPWAQSVGIGLCFLVLGLTVAPCAERQVPDGVWTEAVVASPIVEKPKTVMALLVLPATGEQRRCYLWKDERSLRLQPGSNLLVCLHDGRFASRNDWQPGGNGLSRLSRLQQLRIRAMHWRGWLVGRLAPAAGNEEAEAVLAAMALGDKSRLTRALRERYATTGAAHVLALSGLHLSIIYLLLTRLTLGRRRFWAGQVLVVLAIWAYALLTGLSSSIVRAAVMLTVYALFALGGRRRAPLGVLSFTALLMLLADSRALFDIGFQLSFMAMAGILLFTPLLERFSDRRWMQNHRPARWLFSLTAVSLSAQLGTAPLVAFHFGQFPTWFLLTNLIVIPLATLILYGAALTLLVPALGGALLWVVGLLNTCLDGLSRLPLASIGGLHPSVLQVVMAYVAIAAVYALLQRLRPQGKGLRRPES